MNFQAIFTLIVVAVLAIAAVSTGIVSQNRAENDAQVEMISVVTSAASEALRRAGPAALTNFEFLTDNDYLPEGDIYDTGTGEFSGGGDMTCVGSAANANATCTFEANDANQCRFLADSDERYVNIDGAPTCSAAGVLTLVVTR